jgi:sulfite exporter TauE/SafE
MNMSYYIEIFLIGLLGSMHCIGMCGGFVAMYSLKKPAAAPSLPHHIFYNLGRITTYSLIGGTLGYIGSFAASLGRHRGIPGAVLLFSGVVMVLMGFNLAGILGKRGLFDDTGITERTFFRTALHQILALDSAWGTLLLGILLGFLPCGLLYPLFINAAASGGFVNGMVIMLVFGLGTVPAMFSFGYLVSRIQPHMKVLLYRIAAVLIVLLGVRSLLRGMAFNGWISFGKYW